MADTARRLSFVPACALALVLLGCSHGLAPVRNTQELEARLGEMREDAHIVGMSAAIVSDGEVRWSAGFGYADQEAKRAVTASTPFHLASLTKPFAATIILQLVKEGRVSLDAPASDFGIPLAGADKIRVRHLLSHTSSGTPGTTYAYDGNRFGELDSVITRTLKQSFAKALYDRIVVPLDLHHTAPNPGSPSFAVFGLDQAAYVATLARGYSFTGGRTSATPYPAYFGTAAGLTASVLDVAKFSSALDANTILDAASVALATTPVALPSGESPYGLGWFVTEYRGTRVVWHYGLWTAISSMIIKVPEKKLTFILLANGDALTSPYPLASGRLETSPWARQFIDAFVFGSATLP